MLLKFISVVRSGEISTIGWSSIRVNKRSNHLVPNCLKLLFSRERSHAICSLVNQEALHDSRVFICTSNVTEQVKQFFRRSLAALSHQRQHLGLAVKPPQAFPFPRPAIDMAVYLFSGLLFPLSCTDSRTLSLSKDPLAMLRRTPAKNSSIM